MSWDVHVFVFFYGAGLSFLLALTEVFRQGRFTNLAIITTCLGLVQARAGLYLSGAVPAYPWSIAYINVTVYAIGPLLLRKMLEMLEGNEAKRDIPIYHWLPVILAFIVETGFQAMPAAAKYSFLAFALEAKPVQAIHLIQAASFIHVATYISYVIWLLLRVRKEVHVERFNMALGIFIVPLMGTIIISGGFYFHWRGPYSIGGYFLTATSMLIFVFSAKYPAFLDTLKSEFKRRRYENTQLRGINLDAIASRLAEIMNDDKLYLRESLRLKDLADELLITGHQLSRILNEHYGKSFHEYVNEFRIAEARKMLEEGKQQTILRIAYQVGFNTKATFNSQFLKITGMTPAEYRRRYSST